MANLIANRYEVIKSLGHGGMADVFLALDKVLNREVAIKLLKNDMSSDPVSLERFKREAHSSTKLSHPNIVEIYDVGDDEDQHFIVMEYVKGFTLKQLLRRRGAIPPREAVWMCKQLAGALMEAHKNSLIHRDIKSQNVLIKNDGTVKLADFGIAVLNNAMQLTSKDSVLGSVHYLAPELAKGNPASMQSDIYSLGIVFYELLTGDVPYKGDTPVQIALMHIKNQLPDVRKFNPDIPQSIVNILTKATAKNPSDRYENIALMIKDLSTCFDEARINEAPLIIEDKSKSNSNKKDYKISSSANKTVKNSVQKKVSLVVILIVSILSIACLGLILVLTGAFSLDSYKFKKVPEIIGLRFVSAIDALDVEEIEVDYPPERIMTDDIEEGIVVDVLPKPGSQIEKGTKVKLTISAGKYAIMDDYVGKNIDDVKSSISNKFIQIKINAIENDEKDEGTILEQKGILPGDKYDPNVNNTLIFGVAYPTQTHIPLVLGRNIEEVIDLLNEEGFNVEVELIDINELNEDDRLRYKENEVCKVEPEEGSLYTKSEDSVVKIYYYE